MSSHVQVLYLDLQRDEGYERLVNLAGATRQHFAEAGVADSDTAQGFTPHITVAKLSKMQAGRHWRGGQSCRKIPQVAHSAAPSSKAWDA
jgi:2'-5' RNA ligase